ncbi:hypothetical protein J421_0918 [Gemmatirosa kalamazoonensis]|uniref:PBP domain-containing protein n=1 Tax=Gemmatirosa kalamazoonensis TaxID=861299 RepID=W0RDP9_9BACT|nr:hypothetical protein [Gemmatirosa kalamazoonensis]AHG88455.1 hypothetical protein J421_0918 [Gemmatirosa kalamazoonensis]
MQRRPQEQTRGRWSGATTRRRMTRALTAVGSAVAAAVAARAAATQPPRTPRPESYAVIVHPLVAASGVSLAQLRAMFLGTRRNWDDGARVVLIVQTPGTRTREVLLRELYHMDEAAFKRYWIARTFRSESGTGGPTLVSSDALARRLTASIPGAIAVVPAAEVDGGVRVLRIDGRLPGAEGYPLAAGAP